MSRRTWAAAAFAAVAVGVCALIAGPDAARKLREAVSEQRASRRDRRNAERLAARGEAVDPGPDVRLPVAGPIFDAGAGLAPGWSIEGAPSAHPEPGKPLRVDSGSLVLVRPQLAGSYGGLVFRYRAPRQWGDFLEVALADPGGRQRSGVQVTRDRAQARPDGFAEIWIPMRELDPHGTRFDRVVFRAGRRTGSGGFELDGIGLTALPPPRRQPPRSGRFRIDCRAPGHAISPLVYGIATYFADAGPQQWTMGATARRWGGNHSSRYNPELHAWNLDRDWFFRNAAVTSAESFLAENRSHGLQSALTVPILGWVAKDFRSYSFPVGVFGPQQAVARELPDAGNGLRPDGTPIPPPPPTTTSIFCGPECVERWIGRMRVNRAAGGPGVDLYILDNEPTTWHWTHRDVHPDPAGYDELLERTIAYGAAVRRADPEAVIAGPALADWLSYFYSAKDVATGVWLRPDRLLHGNLPLLPWYLRKLRQYEERTGTRVLDVVDVHFYPAADVGGPANGRTNPATSALRIRTTRSLWDPAYVDESWIDEPMTVLPLLRRWVEENDPRLRISLGEWNFGAEGDMSGGLAAAEALGRFGAEGIYSAFYWTYPPDRSPAYWAFRAYRDFDGHGGRFLDRSMPVSAEARLASLFASRDEAGKRVVAVLLNHHPGSLLEAEVDLDGCGTPSALRAFSYSGNPAGFAPLTNAGLRGQTLHVNVEPYSMTAIEIAVKPP